MKKLTFLFFASILMIGCKLDVDSKLFDMDGEKLTIHKISNDEIVYSNEIDLQLEEGAKISVWNVMDVKYESNPELKYHIDLIDEEGNIKYYSFEALKLSPVIRSGKEIMGKGDWRLKVKWVQLK